MWEVRRLPLSSTPSPTPSFKAANKFLVFFAAQHHGWHLWRRKNFLRPGPALRQRRGLELRRLPTSGLPPPAATEAAVAGGPRRLRLDRGQPVGASVPGGELRQHDHPRLAHLVRGHVSQRRRHRRVGRRPRRRSARHCRHDLQVSRCTDDCARS